MLRREDQPREPRVRIGRKAVARPFHLAQVSIVWASSDKKERVHKEPLEDSIEHARGNAIRTSRLPDDVCNKYLLKVVVSGFQPVKNSLVILSFGSLHLYTGFLTR